ncbi:ATPase [Albidovulum sediminis]|uniref:ATPase n=1 Tax=Albidovulum sediminis TaxID=3066345 RepID=A0ABT2NL32_9RHOB|nr:ATPase [Defluviimonas sediminis]MCT8328664.1 ATPase [Defluviimonas sediminis]
MIYRTADEWLGAEEKRVLLFGMSGLGKTHVSNMLRHGGAWFQYSIDYRIGTRYMGEHIADNFKREAMKVPLLRKLLMTDSVRISSNITFNNLAPLSTYLGKPGDAAKGGLPFAEYARRQDQHRAAEIAALHDTGHFARRAHELYGYPNFVCDSGGSICEVVDPDDPADPVLRDLADTVLMIWIRGDDSHRAELVRRFDRDPKPIYYQPEFLARVWSDYLAHEGKPADRVDPDGFLRFAYARLLDHRQPRYQAMAKNWGIEVAAESVASLRSPADFIDLVARGLEQRR